MIRFLALALVAALTVAPASAEIIGSFVLASSNVDDGVAPVADVYGFQLSNGGDLDVNAIGLTLNAADLGLSTFFVDSTSFANPSDLTFEGALPTFRGAPITDSFVVLPGDLGPLEVNSIFENGRIDTNYTTAGGILVPAMSEVIVAHLSVPAGEVPMMPSEPGATGSVVFTDTTTAPILGIPEPSTALLAGLALVGFVARRK